MKELLLSFVFSLVVGSAINGMSAPLSPAADVLPDETPAAATEPEARLLANISESTDASFKADVLDSQTPVLVDFWATWCGPCKRMLPVLEEVAAEYQGSVKVVRVDVDANPAVSDKYRVNEIPTFMFFKGGKKVESFVGVTAKQKFVDVIEKLIR